MTGPDPFPIEVAVEDLARWKREGIPHVVLDVRESWEIELCLIEGSITIPLGTLPDSCATLPTDRPIVVTCHHGMRSMRAVGWLRRNGFPDATNLTGGIDAWARRIDPTMRVY